MIVASLEALVLGSGERQIGLHGGSGSGKTHLLNASAEYARKQGIDLQIYDAAQLLSCDAAEFEGYGDCEVLAIDNLDAIAGNVEWERAFYQVVNRCRAGEFRLLFALRERPESIDVRLDDFRSRLQWGLLLQLPLYGDEEVREILLRRAALLGIELGDDVLSYLLRRYSRDLAAQMDILARLDGVSLSEQRKVTIPLVKQALGEN